MYNKTPSSFQQLLEVTYQSKFPVIANLANAGLIWFLEFPSLNSIESEKLSVLYEEIACALNVTNAIF